MTSLLVFMTACTEEQTSHENDPSFENDPIEVTQLETNVEEPNPNNESSTENQDIEEDAEENIDDTTVANKDENTEFSYTVNTKSYHEEAKVDVILTASQNGNLIWEMTWPNIYLSELDPHSDFTIHDDRIYIEVHGELFGMNRLTGDEVFDPVQLGVMSKPLVDTDGSIYCEGYYGPFITKISPEGKIIWQENEPPNAMWPMGIELDKNYVYVHYENVDSNDYNMVQLRKDNGQVSRSFWLEENELFFGIIEASSTLQDYPVTLLLDGLKDTAWVEGKQDHGIGETISFKSDSEKTFNKIYIENGYHKSEALFNANGKVKTLKVTIANGRSFDFTLKNSMEVAELNLNETITTTAVKLEILDVYPGEKYTDTAITSVSFIND